MVLGQKVDLEKVTATAATKGTALLLCLCLAGCSETLSPSGEGTFIRGHAEEAFTQRAVVNLGIGLEYTMGFAKPELPPGLAPASVTLDPPAPNPALSTTNLHVNLAEAIPGHVLVIEAASRQLPGTIAEWKNLPLGPKEITWDLRDKFTGEFMPNGLYFVRLLDADLTVLAETRLFINRDGRESAALQAFIAFTDGNGDYVIDDVPVGETFTATDAGGKVLGTKKPLSQVILFHDDLEFHYQEIQVDVFPGKRTRLDFFVDPIAAIEERFGT